MLSNCPKCSKPIEHEDFLFEVVCDCGCRFNPFMLLEGQATAEPPQEVQPAPVFSESQAAFQEIQNFGETLTEPEPAPATAIPGAAPATRPAAPRMAAVPVATAAPGDECPITAGDSLPGYSIDGYGMPVSTVAEVGTGESPLGAAFLSLWQQALAGGGNGIVGLRWVVLPDGARILVAGTPVRLSRSPA